MPEFRNYFEKKQIGKNTYRQRFSTGAVQIKDSYNNWVDIDTTLKSVGRNYWHMNKAPYECFVGKTADRGIRFENDGLGFSWIPLNIRPVTGFHVKHNVIKYPNAYADGIHLEVHTANNCMKKIIVIDKKPNPMPDYIDFDFAMPADNLTALYNDMRGLNIEGFEWISNTMKLLENTERASYIWKAHVWDNAHNWLSLPLKFERHGNTLIMKKRLTRAILERLTYPVMTDASSSINSGSGDGFCYKYLPGGVTQWANAHDATTGISIDTADYVRIGFNIGPNTCSISRAFLAFDTSGITAGSVPTDATLNLTSIFQSEDLQIYIVKGHQASHTAIVDDDYNDCGHDVGNDTTGRAKYTPQEVAHWYPVPVSSSVFTFNSPGVGFVFADGSTWTKLGIRHVNDILNVPFGRSSRVHYASSEHSDSNFFPLLDVTYVTDYTHIAGTGGLGLGGSATLSFGETHTTGTGGLGLGGGAKIIRPVQFSTGNAFSLSGEIIQPDSCVQTSGGMTGMASNVIDYKRPHNDWWSNDLSGDKVLELSFKKEVDMIVLYNCNFASFWFTDTSDTQFSTFQDPDTGLYHGVIRINQTAVDQYAAGIKTFSIKINVGSVYGSLNYYRIGAIVGCKRKELSSPPKYPITKTLHESFVRREFDGGNNEVIQKGYPYHECQFAWDNISYSDFEEIEEQVKHVDVINGIVIHEKWDDYEACYLGMISGDFSFDYINRDRIKAVLPIREYN